MAVNIIKIKRTTGSTAPSSLNAGELAFSGGSGTQSNMGQRLFIGDKVTSDMIDTEKQVFARFYFQSSDPILLKKDLSLFSNILEISSKNLSMISDIFDTTYID